MTPETRAHMVMMAAYMGALGTALMALALLLHWDDTIRGVGAGIMMACLAILLVRKLRDEYLEELWSAGASWALLATIAWSVLVPLYLGTFEGRTGVTWLPDISGNWTMIVAVGAFFAGFHFRRLRGRA